MSFSFLTILLSQVALFLHLISPTVAGDEMAIVPAPFTPVSVHYKDQR